MRPAHRPRQRGTEKFEIFDAAVQFRTLIVDLLQHSPPKPAIIPVKISICSQQTNGDCSVFQCSELIWMKREGNKMAKAKKKAAKKKAVKRPVKKAAKKRR